MKLKNIFEWWKKMENGDVVMFFKAILDKNPNYCIIVYNEFVDQLKLVKQSSHKFGIYGDLAFIGILNDDEFIDVLCSSSDFTQIIGELNTSNVAKCYKMGDIIMLNCSMKENEIYTYIQYKSNKYSKID